MPAAAARILSTVARELDIPADDMLKQGLRSFSERQLCEIKAEIFAISGRSGVSGLIEIAALVGGDSRRDLQRLDHLEHKQDRLSQLLGLVV